MKVIMGILVFCVVIYFTYWLFKTVSYIVFYEDMVQETVMEMVKSGSLK